MEAYNELWNFKPCEPHHHRFLAKILASSLALNRPEMAKILIDNRFQFIPKDDISKALITATRKGYFDVVKLLIEKGADVNARNKIGETALIQALKKRRFAIAKLLLSNGADIWVKDRRGNYAILLFIKNIFAILQS
ncbi:MAG: ankyrin repeat domain-containing protein [Alphaproteobacteria bacterium]|nr:ankyrin repeat domain-containing protein [Alphaproteobacteria bacterium]